MKNKPSYFKRLVEYYSESDWLYKYVWYQGRSRGLHHGFAKKGSNNHQEALLNQYRYVIKKGKLKSGMKVLDAGCGVGGAAVYIAQQTKAEVVGISLVSKQIRQARSYAHIEGVEAMTTFVVGDYHKTEFENENFDVIYGIESICYATPKEIFLKEAWRLLKPGGTLK